jgi:hypothetical protein
MGAAITASASGNGSPESVVSGDLGLGQGGTSGAAREGGGSGGNSASLGAHIFRLSIIIHLKLRFLQKLLRDFIMISTKSRTYIKLKLV